MDYKTFRASDPTFREVSEAIREGREWLDQQARMNDFRTYRVDITEELKPTASILSLEGVGFASEGNISAVVGEAKSKKTYLCSGIVAGKLNLQQQPVLGSDPRPENTVLWVDTEQSKTHVQFTARRIHHLAGYDTERNSDNFRMLALREIDPKQRAKFLFEAIDEWRPRLVVIDGISDLLYNTNDLEESERLITQLMRTSSRLKNHILVVLHTNPGSDKARGHIGSALLRKSESVLYVRKVGDCSIVEPQFCRNEPFERFAFRINEQALPERCELPREVTERSGSEVLLAVREAGGNFVERKVVVSKLCERLGCNENVARIRISRALKRGDLQEEANGTLSLSA